MLPFRSILSFFFTLMVFTADAAKISKRMLDSSVIHQSNGKLGMFLNVPNQCGSIYDEFIAQLQACKSGENLGNDNISHGCLVSVSILKLSKTKLDFILNIDMTKFFNYHDASSTFSLTTILASCLICSPGMTIFL